MSRARRGAADPDSAQARLDARMMRRALSQARRGNPSPNPRVGVVIARGDEVVASGFHARCGGPHAEVVALRRAGEAARGATLYVTMAPCNHHGRTGPCTEAILAAGVGRVVVGSEDPADHGPRGVTRLRRAGLPVSVGVERDEAEALVADFALHQREGRPLVTLKAAVTLDGRLAARHGASKWITGEAARREVHRMRASSDAIMVGVGTVLADDPMLDVRMVRGPNPLRVVLDSQLRTPVKGKLARSAQEVPTLIMHARGADHGRVSRLRDAGVELCTVPKRRGAAGLDLKRALSTLGARGVLRLLVEGGAQLHGGLLEAGLADRAAIFIAPSLLADAAGLPLAAGRPKRSMADAFRLERVQRRAFGDDTLITGTLIKPERTTPADR